MALVLWGEIWGGTELAWGEVWGEEASGFNVVPGVLGLTGALSITGDIEFETAWEFEPPLTITTIVGAVGVSGDIEYVVPFDVEPSTVGVSGALSVSGDIAFGSATDYETGAVSVGISGAVGVSGDIGIEVDTTGPAAVWAFVLSNGKSAGQNLVENNAMLTELLARNCFDEVLQGQYTAGDILRILAAVAAGKTSITSLGTGSATVEFRAIDDSVTTVIGTMSGSQRTAVTLDPEESS